MLDALAGKNAHVELPWETIALRLLLATFLGCVIALIHHFTRGPDDSNGRPTRGFPATLILLSLLLAMVVIIVEGNVARAFSLAGIMAIVRFRTVVENTRDSVFVICAVVVGMATGSEHYRVSVVALPLIAVAAYLTQHGVRSRRAALTALKVRIGLGQEHATRLDALLQRYTDTATLVSSSTAKQGSAVDVEYEVRLKAGVQPLELVREFNRTEGVQEVEWKGS